MKDSKTKVIFRVWKDDGQVIAMFPEIPGTGSPYTCLCYQTIGQHGSASVLVTQNTRPAKPAEFEALKIELENVGYELKITKRFTRHDLKARKDYLYAIRGKS